MADAELDATVPILGSLNVYRELPAAVADLLEFILVSGR
jgi:hypothetical protein